MQCIQRRLDAGIGYVKVEALTKGKVQEVASKIKGLEKSGAKKILLDLRNCADLAGCPVFNRLVGTKIALGSAEVRVPLFGTKEFGLLSGFIPTELEGFVDGAAAWCANGENNACPPGNEKLKFRFATKTSERVPVFSAGVGARFLLSYIPIEVYYARPFQRPDSKWVFGFNIIPGW